LPPSPAEVIPGTLQIPGIAVRSHSDGYRKHKNRQRFFFNHKVFL
jgi:hypothetical protein